MRNVILIILLLLAAAGGWLYFYERETLDRLMGEEPAEAEETPAPESPARPKPKPTPEKTTTTRPKKATLTVPSFDGDIYVNGQAVQAGDRLQLPAGPAVVTAYADGRYAVSSVDLKVGETHTTELKTQSVDTGNSWADFQGNKARTGYTHAKNRNALDLLWQTDLKDTVDCSPVIVGDQALLSTRKSLITALSLADGSVAWRNGNAGSAVSPIATEKYVFAGNNLGKFGGYLLKNGRQKGEIFLETYPLSTAVISPEAFLVTTRMAKVFSIATKRRFTGGLPLKTNWEITLPELTTGTGSPVIIDHTAVFQTQGGLVALNLTDGSRLWPKDVGGVKVVKLEGNTSMSLRDETFFQTPTPAAQGDTLYTFYDGKLQALNAHTGKVHWQHKLTRKVSSSIALAHGMLFFGTVDGHIATHAVADGSLIYRIKVSDQPVFASPVLFRDKLLVATREGRISLHNGHSGQQIAENKALIGAPINSTPAVWDHGILVINNQGKAVCFR